VRFGPHRAAGRARAAPDRAAGNAPDARHSRAKRAIRKTAADSHCGISAVDATYRPTGCWLPTASNIEPPRTGIHLLIGVAPNLKRNFAESHGFSSRIGWARAPRRS
jgi:hypothetical protein